MSADKVDKVDALEAWASAAMELVMHVAELHTRNSMYNTKTLHDAWNAKQQELRAYLRTQPEGYQLLRNSTHEERSFPEDATHENGSYYNKCHICLRQFTGHKRRITCKVCMIAAAQEGKSQSAATSKVVIVAADAKADVMNALHGDQYGVDWVYPAATIAALTAKGPQ